MLRNLGIEIRWIRATFALCLEVKTFPLDECTEVQSTVLVYVRTCPHAADVVSIDMISKLFWFKYSCE